MSAHSNHILVFDQSINQKPQLWKNSRYIIQLSKIFYWSITVRCWVHTSPLPWISFPFRLAQSIEWGSLCYTVDISYLLNTQQCVCANPNLLIRPLLPSYFQMYLFIYEQIIGSFGLKTKKYKTLHTGIVHPILFPIHPVSSHCVQGASFLCFICVLPELPQASLHSSE